MIDDIIRKFKRVDFIGYETMDRTTYFSLFDSLKDFKNNRKANWSNNSVKIDVDNYLYIFNLRNKANGVNFLDIADYFISADGNLCEWGKEILPSTIPIAVLPSVWHSLLLKYKGRTKEDYKAFCLFLNLRYRVIEDDFDKRKPIILNLVQSLDEPVDLKNLILQDITDNITSKYAEMETVPEIVEKAKNDVIEREIKRIFEEEGKPLIDQGRYEGRIELLYEMAEKNASDKINLIDKILKVICFIKLVLGIVIVIGIILLVASYGIDVISKVFKKEIFGYDILNWSTIILMGIGVVVYFVIDPIKSLLSKYDYETLKKIELDKLVEKYKKDQAVIKK